MKQRTQHWYNNSPTINEVLFNKSAKQFDIFNNVNNNQKLIYTIYSDNKIKKCKKKNKKI